MTHPLAVFLTVAALASSTACELVVDDGPGSLATADAGGDGAEAGGEVTEAANGVAEAGGSDVAPPDVVPADCAAGCLAPAASCRQACSAAQDTCVSACHGHDAPACQDQCLQTATGCSDACRSQCSACFARTACAGSSACSN